jgi:hypothetical protein
MGNNPLATRLIAAMSAIVEAPDYPLLKSYKSDFYKRDTEIMKNFCSGDRHLWVVRESGTHLSRLGVHRKESEWAEATINTSHDTSAGREIYLVTAKGLALITHSKAMDEIRKYDYEVTRNAVFKKSDNSLVATYSAEVYRKPADGNVYVSVVFQSSQLESLNLSTLNALRVIADAEGTEIASSFFKRIEVLTINGQSLVELIESKSMKSEQVEMA